MIELVNREFRENRLREIEKIEREGSNAEIWGIKTTKDYKEFLKKAIDHYSKYPSSKFTGKDVEMILRKLLKGYDYFYKK